jgi:hypothetical protein
LPVALAILAMLALAGQLILNAAAATIGRGLGKDWTIFTTGFDFWPIWREDRYWITGQHAPYWYGKGISDAWPPPHEVAFAPLSVLSFDAAHVVTIVMCAVLMVVALLLWARRAGGRGFGAAVWPVMLSAPVFAVVWIDQLQSVTGVCALSLALWAQRKNLWWLVGPAAAFGVIRVPNAIPVLVMLLLGGWGRWRQLGIAALAGLAFMAPMMFVAFLWDPHWITDYIAGINSYPFNGAPKLASGSFGYGGLAALVVVGCAAALWLVRRDVGRPLEPGRAALGMALTVLVAPLGGLYSAIFVLPALIQLGLRRGFWIVPWIAAAGPWVVIVALSPLLLGADPGLTLNYVSFIDYGLLLLAYPLLRIPPGADVSHVPWRVPRPSAATG